MSNFSKVATVNEINTAARKKKQHSLKKKKIFNFVHIIGPVCLSPFLFCKLQSYRFDECFVHDSPSSSASSRMTGTPKKKQKHFQIVYNVKL